MKTIQDPVVVGGVSLKNRMIRSATFENPMNSEGKFASRLVPVYEALAKGGAGYPYAEEISRHQLGDYVVICLNEGSGTLDETIVKLPAGVNPSELQKTANWNRGGMNYFVVDTGKEKFLFDVDPVMAVNTRKLVMEQLAESGEPVAGMHILAPSVGTLQKFGTGYRFASGL